MMPAYNHTRRGVVERTRDHVTLYQSGDFHCKHSPCRMKYIGRSSLEVQRHFEDAHGFQFGHLVWPWVSDTVSRKTMGSHVVAEGIS